MKVDPLFILAMMFLIAYGGQILLNLFGLK
jgi:hypothetical protein